MLYICSQFSGGVVEIVFGADVVLLIGDRLVRFTGGDAADSVGMGFRADRRAEVVVELCDTLSELPCLRFRLVIGVDGARAVSASSDGGGGDRSESDSSFTPSSAASSDVDFENV